MKTRVVNSASVHVGFQTPWRLACIRRFLAHFSLCSSPALWICHACDRHLAQSYFLWCFALALMCQTHHPAPRRTASRTRCEQRCWRCFAVPTLLALIGRGVSSLFSPG